MMRTPRRRRRLPWLVLGALAAALLPDPAPAQELTGVALGPDGEPLADVPVILHRVGGGGGAFVATDTTSADGAFRFPLESDGSEGDPAIYFAALRFEDRLYIGPAVEAGSEPVSGYELRVEPGSEAGAVASALGGRAQGPGGPAPAAPGDAGPSDAGAFALVGLLALGAVGVFLVAAPRYRDRRTRDAVIELAMAENGLAEPGSVEERARLEATRDRLRKQLAPRS